MDAPEILLVSKPVCPPWNDSGKNLVRDLVEGCRDVRFRVFTRKGVSLGLPHVAEEPLYAGSGAFSPSLRQNARVLARLLRPDRQALYHFFFAPNPRTSLVARAVTRAKRRRTVQTITSIPADFDRAVAGSFADRVVALSESTHDRLRDAGVRGVVRIPPSVPVLEPVPDERRSALHEQLSGSSDRPLVVFPGDYEFSRAAFVLADAIPRVLERVEATFVYACREKRPASRAIAARVRASLAPHERAGAVRFVGETPDIRTLLAASAAAVLPAESTYAKMDLPLVLLEALAEGTPVVVADVAPLREVLGARGLAPPEPVGVAVPPLDAGALADALVRLLEDDGRREAMGRAGRAWVAEAFSVRAMGAAYASVYTDLLDA
jgi:phosphatidylinositol alpha-1,6-mannosyltransferase